MPTALRGLTWFPKLGINNTLAPHMVETTMCIEAQDVVYDESVAGLIKRDGYAEVNATAVSASPVIDSLFSLYLSTGTKYEVLGTRNGGIWKDESGTVTASVFTGLSTTYPAEYTQFLDLLIVLDGTNVAKTWSGTATGTISAAATGASFGETHLNRLFLTGITGAMSRVDYSAAGSYTDWTSASTDQFNVEQNNGQNITGIKSYSRNELLIFKERSFFKLVGFDKSSFNLITVDRNVGCLCHRAIKVFKGSTSGGLAIWPAYDGLYVYDGGSTKKISGYMQTTWDTINRTKYRLINATLDDDKGRYIISFATGSSTVCDKMLVVDLLHPFQDDNGLHFPIWKWTSASQALNTEIISSTNVQRIVFGASAGKKNYFGRIYSDSGSAIDAYVISPLLKFDDGLGESDCLRRIYSSWLSTTGTITVDLEDKDGTDWIAQPSIIAAGGGASIGIDFQIGVSPIGIPESTFTTRTSVAIRSRRIKLRIRQSSSNRYFNLQPPIELYFKSGGQDS